MHSHAFLLLYIAKSDKFAVEQTSFFKAIVQNPWKREGRLSLYHLCKSIARGFFFITSYILQAHIQLPQLTILVASLWWLLQITQVAHCNLQVGSNIKPQQLWKAQAICATCNCVQLSCVTNYLYGSTLARSCHLATRQRALVTLLFKVVGYHINLENLSGGWIG